MQYRIHFSDDFISLYPPSLCSPFLVYSITSRQQFCWRISMTLFITCMATLTMCTTMNLQKSLLPTALLLSKNINITILFLEILLQYCVMYKKYFFVSCLLSSCWGAAVIYALFLALSGSFIGVNVWRKKKQAS